MYSLWRLRGRAPGAGALRRRALFRNLAGLYGGRSKRGRPSGTGNFAGLWEGMKKACRRTFSCRICSMFNLGTREGGEFRISNTAQPLLFLSPDAVSSFGDLACARVGDMHNAIDVSMQPVT